MKTLNFFILSIIFLVASCNNEDLISHMDSEDSINFELRSTVTNDSIAEIDSIVETEESKNLKEILESNQSKSRSLSIYDSYYDENLLSNLYSLAGLPIYIKSRYYNNNKQYLTAVGDGKELILKNNDGSNNQKFLIKRYSATTGLDNIITLFFQDKPISAGVFKNNVDVPILYLRPNSSGSLYSANWTIEPTESGYVKLINNGLIAQEGSGYWNIYYKVMGVGNNDKISFGKYVNNNSKQEFEIISISPFIINSIEYIDCLPNSITYDGLYTITRSLTNPYSYDIEQTISFLDTKKLSSSFAQKRNINFNFLNPAIQFKRPEIVNKKLFSTPSANSPVVLSYNSFNYTENVGHKESLRVTIPKGCRVDFSYSVVKYNVRLAYKLKATNYKSEVIISGIWNGTIYSDEIQSLEHKKYPLRDEGTDIPLRSISLKNYKGEIIKL